MAERIKREKWLDALKGVAIILVVIGHIIDGNLAKGTLTSMWVRYIYNGIYLFHMPLFFTLSGMAYALSKKTNGGVSV